MSSRPPNPKRKKRTISRKYTSSFSGIDWGSFMLTASFKPRQSDFSVSSETLDLPSLSESNHRSSSNTFHRKDSSGTTASGTQLFVEQVLQEEVGGGNGNNGGRWRDVAEYYKPTTSKRASFDQSDHNNKQRSENDSDIDEDSLNSNRRSPWFFVMMVLVLLVGAVACFITLGPNTAILQPSGNLFRGKANVIGALDDTVQQQLIDPQLEERGQEMLNLAERITTACGTSLSSSSLGNTVGGLKTCQDLCHRHMCCVEEDEEYSCVEDVSMECAVYAGCVVLVDDNFW